MARVYSELPKCIQKMAKVYSELPKFMQNCMCRCNEPSNANLDISLSFCRMGKE